MTNTVEEIDSNIDTGIDTDTNSAEYQQEVLEQLADLYAGKIIDTYKTSDLEEGEKGKQLQELVDMDWGLLDIVGNMDIKNPNIQGIQEGISTFKEIKGMFESKEKGHVNLDDYHAPLTEKLLEYFALGVIKRTAFNEVLKEKFDAIGVATSDIARDLQDINVAITIPGNGGTVALNNKLEQFQGEQLNEVDEDDFPDTNKNRKLDLNDFNITGIDTAIENLDENFANKVVAFMYLVQSETGHVLKIAEGLRTSKKQAEYYGKGRTEKECIAAYKTAGFNTQTSNQLAKLYSKPDLSKITWTMNSKHIKGLAIDVIFETNATDASKTGYDGPYEDLYEIGKRTGVINPEGLRRKGDLCHFEDDGNDFEDTNAYGDLPEDLLIT